MEPMGEAADDAVEVDVPRRNRTGLVVALVVALVAAGLVAVLATRAPATDREATSELIGEVAPALSGQTLDGGSFAIDRQRGRWVVVNFFATWCTPCIQEHPELVAFDEAHRRTGDAVVVSVLFDDNPGRAGVFFADNGGEWPVVTDPQGRVALDYGVTGVPETYLVAPSGRVAAKLTGGVTQDGLDRLIADIEAAAGGAG